MKDNFIQKATSIAILITISSLLYTCIDENIPPQQSVSTYAIYTDYPENVFHNKALTIAPDNSLYLSTSSVGKLTSEGEILFSETVGNFYNWPDVNERYSFFSALTFNSSGERFSALRANVIYPWDDVPFERVVIIKGEVPSAEAMFKSPASGYSRPPVVLLAVANNQTIYGAIHLYEGSIMNNSIYSSTISIFDETGQNVIAGANGLGYVDGEPNLSRFRRVSDLAIDKDNNLIVADPENNCLRKVTPQGIVSTIAGSFFEQGYKDGPLKDALFNKPSGIAIDNEGNIYVADSGNHCIRKISTDGNVTTIAGRGIAGFKDAPANEAQFSSPLDVAIGIKGELYILDSGNKSIRLLK